MSQLIPDHEFLNIMYKVGIPFKEKGQEIHFEYCPFCGKRQGDRPYEYFKFNREKQQYICNHQNSCGKRGSLFSFQIEMGFINPIERLVKKSYKRPKEDKLIITDSEKFYQWYERERGVKIEVLKKYNVGYKKQTNGWTIVYQVYNVNKQLINREYKDTTKKTKTWQEIGAEINFYGLQFLNFDDKIIYIVEGKDDLHIMIQMGFKNVLSVPNATTYTPEMDRICKKFETMILLFDCDKAGQPGAYNFAKKAGMHKCYNVQLPYKDARECYLEGLRYDDFMKLIGKAEQFKHQSIIRLSDIREQYLKDLHTKDKLGRMTPYIDFNRLFGGIRMGETTLITGHTGTGKSTFSLQLAYWMEEVGLPTMILSFENQLSETIDHLIQIHSGMILKELDEISGERIIKISDKYIYQILDELQDKNFYLLNRSTENMGYYTLENIQSIYEYCIKFYNVKLFIFDHLHYCLKLSGEKNPILKQEESIRQIVTWNIQYQTHTILVVHPRKTHDKEGQLTKLGLNSPRGSGSIPQETHNFIVIERANDGEDDYRSRITLHKARGYGVPYNNEIVFKLKPNKSKFYM